MRGSALLAVCTGFGCALAAPSEMWERDSSVRQATYISTCTPADGVLAFSQNVTDTIWNVSDTALGGPLPFTSHPPANIGSGVLLAGTNVANASVNFAYFGSGFQLRGTGNASLSVQVNAEEQQLKASSNHTHSVLVERNHTDAAWRNVTVALEKGSMEFLSVDIMHTITISANNGDEAPTLWVPSTWVSNLTLNDAGFYAFEGPWEAKNVSIIEAASTAQLHGPGSVSFNVPANTTFVRLNGHTIGGNCASYDVDLMCSNSSSPVPMKQGFTPLCPVSGPSVLYETALSPFDTYSIVVTSRAARDEPLAFTNAQFMSSTLDLPYAPGYNPGPNDTNIAQGSSSSHKGRNIAGIIAGSVVGGVAGLALLALLLWCCCRRRRRRHSVLDEEDGKRAMTYADGSLSPTAVPAIGYGGGKRPFWVKRLRRPPPSIDTDSDIITGPPSPVPSQPSPQKPPPPVAAGEGNQEGTVSSRRSKFSTSGRSLLSRSKEALSAPMAEREQRQSKQTYASGMTHMSWSSWDVLDSTPVQGLKSKFSNSSWSFINAPSTSGPSGSTAGPSAAAASASAAPVSTAAPASTTSRAATPDSPLPAPRPLSPLPSFNPPAFDAYANRSDSEVSTLPRESMERSRSFDAGSTYRPSTDDHSVLDGSLGRSARSAHSVSSLSNLSSFNISRTSFRINPLISHNVNLAPRSALARAAAARAPGAPKSPTGPRSPRSPRSPTSPTRPNGPMGPRAPNKLMRTMSARVNMGAGRRVKPNLPDVRLSSDDGGTLERLEKEVKRGSQQGMPQS